MLTYEAVDQLLTYNPDNGEFSWKSTIGPRAIKGGLAGTVHLKQDGKSYITIAIRRKHYSAHRLAFLLMTKCWPTDEVDHEDGNGTNNRWGNLKAVSKQQNARNYRRSKRNSSSVVGVGRVNRKWRASIHVDGKKLHLGYFDEFQDAVDARKAAEAVYGYHPNHGQDRPL